MTLIDPSAPKIEIENQTVVESASQVLVTVRLSEAVTTAVTVNVSTATDATPPPESHRAVGRLRFAHHVYGHL